MRTVVRRKPQVVDRFVDAALDVVNAYLGPSRQGLMSALERLEKAAGDCAKDGEFIYERAGDE